MMTSSEREELAARAASRTAALEAWVRHFADSRARGDLLASEEGFALHAEASLQIVRSLGDIAQELRELRCALRADQ